MELTCEDSGHARMVSGQHGSQGTRWPLLQRAVPHAWCASSLWQSRG
eukprot:CAMPEP_0206043154 /NCGR_PEP_ID=MMETSP1466-20131121/7898_1 /ASSEMBLY_ACC=CAM_ASM_001126 /TAXON_ID=44452 /ORGANISM="Pavlova gyrans, Strain CCMP608" /LENGTH=46 /DNA_ID= /DNA_START= /DNA_END= /DNA_ORIENTATION=